MTQLQVPAAFNIDAIAELLVDLDRIVENTTDLQECARYTTCRVYNEHSQCVGTEGILEGEAALPGYVWIDDQGHLVIRMRVPQLDVDGNRLDFGYASFDWTPSTATPFTGVQASLERETLLNHGLPLMDLVRALPGRLHGKPQLIAHLNEQINHGRKMRACNLLELEGEVREDFYDRQEDYGIF